MIARYLSKSKFKSTHSTSDSGTKMTRMVWITVPHANLSYAVSWWHFITCNSYKPQHLVSQQWKKVSTLIYFRLLKVHHHILEQFAHSGEQNKNYAYFSIFLCSQAYWVQVSMRLANILRQYSAIVGTIMMRLSIQNRHHSIWECISAPAQNVPGKFITL